MLLRCDFQKEISFFVYEDRSPDRMPLQSSENEGAPTAAENAGISYSVDDFLTKAGEVYANTERDLHLKERGGVEGVRNDICESVKNELAAYYEVSSQALDEKMQITAALKNPAFVKNLDTQIQRGYDYVSSVNHYENQFGVILFSSGKIPPGKAPGNVMVMLPLQKKAPERLVTFDPEYTDKEQMPTKEEWEEGEGERREMFMQFAQQFPLNWNKPDWQEKVLSYVKTVAEQDIAVNKIERDLQGYTWDSLSAIAFRSAGYEGLKDTPEPVRRELMHKANEIFALYEQLFPSEEDSQGEFDAEKSTQPEIEMPSDSGQSG